MFKFTLPHSGTGAAEADGGTARVCSGPRIFHVQKPAMRMSSGVVGALVVFGGGGKRFMLGAGVTGAGDGGVTTGSATGWPLARLQLGQTHCTVHWRTGVSFVTVNTFSL
jgi:hypothetical protein